MLTASFFEKGQDSKLFFDVVGDFGELTGTVLHDNNRISLCKEKCEYTCIYEEDNNGVIVRNDEFKNTSEERMNISSIKSRFVFEGGEYEVYSQYNNWQTENIGAWQPLVTGVSVSCRSVRSAQNAAPFVVLWNKQQNRGAVIHLMTDCAWEINITRLGLPQRMSKIMVELGPADYNFNYTLEVGKTIKMPQIICYETQNRLDFDAWKLHSYMHTNYPRRQMPMIYNTWMYRYTDFTPELLYEQAKLASDMGLEYFVIDAGWFGRAGMNWFDTVGDWYENTDSGFCGSMKEFSDNIRALGLKFGLWLEVERAVQTSQSVKEHGEFYLECGDESSFLDFANEDAVSWMIDVVSQLIDRYGVEYIKFDFNADLFYDKSQTSFMRYFEGFYSFMSRLRTKYPLLYMTGCAGGGERTVLSNYTVFDSFWPSDNESPYEEMRIYKESLLRLPPQGFERWTCVHSLKGYDDFYAPYTVESHRPSEKIIACCDAWWYDISGVHPSYLKAYHTCGPIGFSCDLKELSKSDFESFRELISSVKAKRDFWKNAVARIIADTETVTVYEYSDTELTDIIVQVVSSKAMQNEITVYPAVDKDKEYALNGDKVLSGEQITKEGIDVPVAGWHEMSEITLNALK